MLQLNKSTRVLAIGAHPDDIELGAGGFIYRLTREFKAKVHYLILTQGIQRAPGPREVYDGRQREQEACDAAMEYAIPPNRVEVRQYFDCRLHESGHDLIREIERRLYGKDLKPRFDLVVSHAGEDTHADHRAVHEATLSAVRAFHGTVLFYQAPSTKPNGFHPTFCVRLDKSALDIKNAALQHHASQRDKDFMDASRTNGLAAGWAFLFRMPPDTFLEAFEVYKSFC